MLISFLRSIYHSERPPAPLENAESFLAEVELFGLQPQLYYLLQTSGLIVQLPVSLQQELKDRYARTLGQSLFFKHKEEELLRQLESRNLDAIVLKGSRFAERYFGHFAARLSSDIDLLVPRNRLQETIDALTTEGYRHEITKDHHARLLKNGVLVELHWTPDMPDWSNLNAGPFWKTSEKIVPYQYIKELSPLHTLYFICLHGARHQMSSPRYLLDIMQILHTHAEHIRMEDFLEQTKADRTTKRVQAVLSIVYRQFPHLHDVKPLPFPLMETPWNYDMIRKAWMGEKTGEYYRYKLFFRHFIFDTLKHQIKSIRKPY